MILKTLYLKNFRQYEELQLDFKEGLTGIVGKNGAGKSSIFEAVLICLFGEIRGDKKYLRSSWVPKKEAVRLELYFEVENRQYRILREYRGKALAHQAHLYDYQDQLIASMATPVNKEIEKLIGMDKEAFTRSIFSGQKELGEISNTRGEDRRKMVRKMVGLDKLDHIQRMLRNDLNELKSMIKGKSELLLDKDALQEKQKEGKALEKELSKEQSIWDKLNSKLLDKQKKYESIRKDWEVQNDLYKKFNEAGNALIKYQEGVQSLIEKEADIAQQIKELQALKKELLRQAPQIKAFEQKKKQLAKLEETRERFNQLNSIQQEKNIISRQADVLARQLNELQGISKRIEKGQQHLAEQQSDLDNKMKLFKRFDQSLHKLNEQVATLLAKIEERKDQIAQIKKLGKDANCPTCFQPLAKAYEDTLARFQKDINAFESQKQKELTQQINQLKKDIAPLKSEIEQIQLDIQKSKELLSSLQVKNKQYLDLRSQQQKLQSQINLCDKQIKDLGNIRFDQKQFDLLKDEIKTFEVTYIQYRSQQDDTAKLPERIQARKEIQERIKKGKTLIKEKQQEIKALRFSEANYQKTQEKRKKAETERDQQRLLLDQQKDLLNALNARMQVLQNDLQQQDDIRQMIQSQEEELKTLKALDALFTKFKSIALSKVRPIISQHATQLFHLITKGRYEKISVNENFEFFISDNGQEYPITRFSGGEVDLANLCLRIGISKAISELSGSAAAMHLLCFDEIFGSQDDDRRHAILHALDLLKEQYRQIYIISHIDSIRDYFPNILHIRKEGTSSQANWL